MVKPRRKKKQTAQTAVVIGASVAAIISLIVVGLSISGTINLEALGVGGEGGGYRNVTLTDAQYKCEKQAREKFDSRIATLTIDALSSRYDEKTNRFKMYFSLDLYPERANDSTVPVNHFLNCFVHGSRGSVTHFENVENKESGPEPIRKSDGNIFGF